MRDLLSDSLQKFIKSGLLDYAYVESKKHPIDLSLGINPLGCSPKVRDFLSKEKLDISSYPEVLADSLRAKIGKVYGFGKENILVGAGASELLHLCLLSFVNQDDDVLIPEISFPAFEFITILVRGKPSFIPFISSMDLDYARMKDLIKKNTKVCIFCNPNNPTGRKLNKEETLNFISANRDVVFVIDEANIDFGGDSLIDSVLDNPNLLVIRSFSKGFGLAGLRVGFVVGSGEIIYALKRRQTPFMVNIYAQEAAKIALDDLGFLKKSKEYCQNERSYLEKGLRQLGFVFIQSDANYLLIDITSHAKNSREFVEKLHERGVNVVNGDNFRGLGGRYIRICPRLHKINESFLKILDKL